MMLKLTIVQEVLVAEREQKQLDGKFRAHKLKWLQDRDTVGNLTLIVGVMLLEALTSAA